MDAKQGMKRADGLTIVVPVFNEAAGLAALHAKLMLLAGRLRDQRGLATEIVCVDDGSRDDTLDRLVALHRRDPRVRVIELSRNFGKEIALTAGLDAAVGDAVVPIDADLQDPPELIPEMLARWREGYDVVYATRIERAGETWLKKATAGGFYRLMERLSDVPMPPNTGDFRLMARPAVDALREAGASPGHLEVRARREGERAVVEVEDDGPGVPDELRERIFEPFYRVLGTAASGTGLGLAIVKHVLQRHDARLHIASVPGQGSVFSVDFPAGRLRDAALARPGAASA